MADKNFTQFTVDNSPGTGVYLVGHNAAGNAEVRIKLGIISGDLRGGLASSSDLTSHTSNNDIHRQINDASTASTVLWSAQKINSELGNKQNTITDSDDIAEGSTNLYLTTGERAKLSGIEAGADRTDYTNVNAAGAVMTDDTVATGWSFVLHELDLSSNSQNKLPTQRSVKTYVDNAVAGISGGGGNVTSVFGRSGVVTATSGDYNDAKITNTSNIAGDSTKDALNTILANFTGHTGASNIHFQLIDEDSFASNDATKAPSQQSVKAYVDNQIASVNASGGNAVSSVFGRTGIVAAASGDYDDAEITNTSVIVGDSIKDALETFYTSFTGHTGQSNIHFQLIDEDNMASNDATKAPSQQSVKAFVETQTSTIESVSVTGDRYILTEDAGKALVLTEIAGSPTLTIRTHANEAVPVGSIVKVISQITGNVTITGEGGIDIQYPNFKSNILQGIYSTAELHKIGTSTWIINVDGRHSSDDILNDTNLAGTYLTEAINNLNTSFTNHTGDVVLTGATSTANFGFVVDEDNFASNSNTKVPTQQSVKVYVDTAVAGVGGDGSVDSVFGRSGVVTATSGDYNDAKITNSSNVSGDSVKDALNVINTNLGELNNHVNATNVHFYINDSDTSTTGVWSSDKVSTTISAKQDAITNSDDITEGATNLYFTSSERTKLSNITDNAIADVVEDTSPQLGGNLDTNSNHILIDTQHGILDENGQLQIKFITTADAVTFLNVQNAASGNTYQLSIDSTNEDVNFNVQAKGAGEVLINGYSSAHGGITDLSSYQFFLDEDNFASNDDTKVPSQQSVKAYVDGAITNFITASSTTTFTNKTFDANGVGNSISNLEVADFAAGVIDTDLSSVSASDNTLASAKAIKAYVDSQAGGSVASVFSRTGIVTATSGDYTSHQITNLSTVQGDNVSVALGVLNGTLNNITGDFATHTGNASIHLQINDSVTGANHLWSSSKIYTEFKTSNNITVTPSGNLAASNVQAALYELQGDVNSVKGVYRNLYIDAGAFVSRTTSGAAEGTTETSTNDLNYDYYAFDGAAEEGINFKLMMPDEWDGGAIKYKVAYLPASGASQNDGVVFGLSAVAIDNDDAIDATLGTQITVTDTITAGVHNDLHITPASSALTVGGSPAGGKLIMFELTRQPDNGSDSMTEDANIVGIQIQYKESSSAVAEW